jgi:uncharacterized membrane protein YdjX (TVP38/TMEM64 family)
MTDINAPLDRGTIRAVATWRRLMPLIVLVAIMGIGFAAGVHKHLSLETVVATRDRFQAVIIEHRVFALLAFVAAYALTVSLSFPGALLFTLAGGLMFGWLQGGIAAVIGATLGASIVFKIAQSAVGETLAKRAGPQVARLQAGFRENALSYLLFLRLVPAFPFFVVNIVPALLGVPFQTYLVGTFFGVMPGTFAYGSVGAGLDSVLKTAKAEQAACLLAKAAAACPLKIELSTLITTELKIASVLLSTLALLPIALKKFRQRKGRAHA